MGRMPRRAYPVLGGEMSQLKKRFGKLLQNCRRRRGLTQAQLAEKAGVSLDLIAKLETGATAASFKSIEALADALAVDPAEFFTSELVDGVVARRALNDITAKMGGLSDEDLGWLSKIVDAALAPRR